MEVKVNKDIQEYQENMYFGLTMRQFFFSVLGCATAIGLYFLCRNTLGLEVTTWVCVLGVVPWAAMGFLKYNGMSAEQFVWCWFKTKYLEPRHYLSEPVSYYYEIMREGLDDKNT